MSKFLSYILNLRGVAIFIVVGVHARGNLSDWTSHLAGHDLLSTFFDAREGNGTVMFIFIGGFLFQYITHNNFEFRKYMEKKFMYVIMPYILISIPIIAFRIYTNFSYTLPPGFNDQSIFYRFLYYMITGLHLAPFWFISAIVLFYLSAPLFHALDNPKAYRYVFPLVFLTCFFTYRSQFNANPFLSYLHYFPIYYLGMWACFNRTKILSMTNWLLIPMIVAYSAITIGNITGLMPLRERISFEEIIQDGLIIFNVDVLKAVLLCFILMVILYRYRERRFLFLEMLGEYSFGIFFVHCIFIYGSRRVLIDIFGPIDFSFATFTIYFSFILLLSTATVFFIKKMTGRYSRILIGS
ncbi:MAG TPA: acyltransferase [Chryseosolibacter sp.]